MATRHSSLPERSQRQLNNAERTFRNRGEAEHWSRAQVAVLGRFNWPSKSKARPEMVVTLASEIADKSLLSYRKRTERNGK